MACDPQSGWVTAVQVGAATLSPIIALVGGRIAWLQVRINRNKLKLDRFDRRFAIHEAAMKFAASIVVDGDLTTLTLEEFTAKTRGARFLVSKEIDDYLDELRIKASRFRLAMRSLKETSNTDQQRAQYADQVADLAGWFQKQLEVIPEKFTPYLSVDDI